MDLNNELKKELDIYLMAGDYKYIPERYFVPAIEKVCQIIAKQLQQTDSLNEENLSQCLDKFIVENNTTLFGVDVIKKVIPIFDENGKQTTRTIWTVKGKEAQSLFEKNNEIIKTSIKQICQEYKTHNIPHKSNALKFAEAMKKIGCNWDINHLDDSWTAMRKLFESIYHTIGQKGARQQDVVICLEQLENGGGGKGTLVKSIVRVLSKYGLTSDYDDLPRERFNSNISAVNSLVIHDDITLKGWKQRNAGVFNQQIDKNVYTFELKGQNGGSVKAKATHIITTNYKLMDDSNNRRMLYIKYANSVFRPMSGVVNNRNLKSKEILEKYFECYPYKGNEDTYQEKLDKYVEQAFLSCPLGYDYRYNERLEIKEAKIPARYSKILYEVEQYRDNFIYNGVCNDDFKVKEYLSNMSFNELIKNSSFKDNDFDYNKKYFLSFITDLKTYADHKIDKHGNRFPYYKTDWNKILSYPIQNETDEEKFEDIDDEEEKFEKAFAELYLNAMTDNETPPPDNTTETTQNTDVEKTTDTTETPTTTPDNTTDTHNTTETTQNIVTQLSDGNLFVDKFTTTEGVTLFKKCETTNTLQEYVVVNKPLPHNDGTSRKNGDVEQNCFLLEIDAQQEDKEEFERNNPDKQFKGSKEEESAKKAISRYMQPFYKQYKDCLKWVCKSGRVSVHMVLKTNLPKDVVNQELRKYIFERINGIFFDNKLDSQCKNAGRLGRNPNAVRDNGNVQTALFINEDCKEFDVSPWVKEFEELQSFIVRPVGLLKQFNNDPTIQELERIVTSTNKESGLLALDLAKGNRVPSGSNLIGAIGYMETLAEHHPEFTDLYHKVWTEAHNQHPTNITSLPH